MRLTLLLMCVVLGAAPAPARAESKAEEAKKHFNRSKELYDDGDFAAALNELERAYAAVPNFKLLFNIGQIQAQLTNYAAALKSFRKFLTDGGSEVSETRRAEVLREIDKLRTRVAELTVVCPEGAEVSIDDVVVGKAPLPEPITVNVGRRKVMATLPNYFPVTKFVEVAGLDMLNVKLELQPMVSQPAATREAPAPATEKVTESGPPQPPKPLAVWIPWVGTGVLGAGTAVMGIMSLQASTAQKSLLGTYGITRAELDAAASKTRTLALVTDILAGCTGAAAIGSLLYTLLRPADAPPTVSLGFSTNSVVVSGSF